MATSEIAQLVQSFATELSALVRRDTIGELQKLLEAQIGVRGARRRSPKVLPAKLRRGGTVSDTTKLSEAVVAFVRANPGARGEQVASSVRSTSSAIRPTVKALLAAGVLRSEGERRGMKYFAVDGAGAHAAGRHRGAGAVRASESSSPGVLKARSSRKKQPTTSDGTNAKRNGQGGVPAAQAPEVARGEEEAELPVPF
jgi:hypothetical protein